MDIKDYVYSGTAVQVKFWDGENWCIGIMIGRRIICACCGGVFDVDEVLSNAREEGYDNPIIVYDTWVDISDEIRGDDDDEEDS